MAPWRTLPYDIGPSARHFAHSDILVRRATTPTIWWHSADQPTLILGPGQREEGIDSAECRRRGVTVTHRQAGGAAVLAGPGVLGLDVALPGGHPLALSDIVEAYRWLGEAWVAAARQLGANAELVTIELARARRAGSNPACFGSLSSYEVAVDGRKLVGLAQLRRRNGVLLQSAIHLRFDADGLACLLRMRDEERRALQQSAVGLEEIAGAQTENDIMETFAWVLRDTMDVTLQKGAWTDADLEAASAAPV